VDTLSSIKIFQQVVESGSFVGAAARLSLSTAATSKHVMHLERRLGARLLNRGGSRSLSLTEPGRVYFERCKGILAELEEAELEVGSLHDAPRGTLRVTCPSWSGTRRVAELLADYRRRYPEVVLDIAFEDRLVDVVAEGYDLALRVTTDQTPGGLVARPLGPVPFVIAASADYLKRRGVPKSPEDLADHDCVIVGKENSWHLAGTHGALEVPARVVLRFRSMNVGVAHAACAGVGLALLPWMMFDDPMFRGKLRAVLSDYPLRQPNLYAIHVSRRHVPPKIRTFVDHVAAHMARGQRPTRFEPLVADTGKWRRYRDGDRA
jgi:DNA-binding transcriptional LysR family regulator